MTSSNEILWKLLSPEMKSWLRSWVELWTAVDRQRKVWNRRKQDKKAWVRHSPNFKEMRSKIGLINSDVVETVIFETGTQDLKFETETSKFVYFAEILKKCCHHGRPQGV